MLATLPRQQQDGLPLGLRGLVPMQDFLELTTAAETDVVFVEAAVAHARRLHRWGGWLIPIGSHNELDVMASRRPGRPSADAMQRSVEELYTRVEPETPGMVFAGVAR